MPKWLTLIFSVFLYKILENLSPKTMEKEADFIQRIRNWAERNQRLMEMILLATMLLAAAIFQIFK